MKQFNYKKAWDELAQPAYAALPQNIRDLVALTSVVSAHLKQKEDLDMPWPNEHNIELVSLDKVEDALALRNKFAKIPAEWLAKASRAVFFFGHWGYGRYEKTTHLVGEQLLDSDIASQLQKCGGYHSFSNYADQDLSSRLGIVRNRTSFVKGISFTVLEGCIRLQWCHSQGWSNRDICLATTSGWGKIQSISLPDLSYFGRIQSSVNAAYDAFDKYANDLMNFCQTDSFKQWDTERFMEEENETI